MPWWQEMVRDLLQNVSDEKGLLPPPCGVDVGERRRVDVADDEMEEEVQY